MFLTEEFTSKEMVRCFHGLLMEVEILLSFWVDQVTVRNHKTFIVDKNPRRRCIR